MRLIVVVAYVLRKPSVHLNDDSGRGDSTAFDFNQPPIFCFSFGLHRGGMCLDISEGDTNSQRHIRRASHSYLHI